jgi:hypothetical protein
MSDAIFVQLSLTGEPSVLESCRKAHFAHEFDFNSVIPMPPALDVEESSAVTTGYDALYGDWTEPAKYWTWKESAASLGLAFPLQSREELLACIRSLDCADMYLVPAKQLKENVEKYGHGTWYGWCKQHWGTQRNAEDSVISASTDRIVVRFTIVGAFPKKVLATLSKLWPGISVHIQYADEHARRGRDYVVKNGREIDKVERNARDILESICERNDAT